MRNTQRLSLAVLAATILAVAVVPEALAGQGGAEFASIYATLTGWLTGTLGKVIAITFIIVGLVGGAVRGSIAAFVIGIASGLGMFVTPSIIDNVVTAVL